MFNKVPQKPDQPIDSIYDYVVGVVRETEVKPTCTQFPSFADLKQSPEIFYKYFSQATYNYTLICDTLQKLQHTNAIVIKMINELMNQESLLKYDIRSQYSKQFISIKSELAALLLSYETAKASSEAIVKFYNSAQYIITSGGRNFDGTSANY